MYFEFCYLRERGYRGDASPENAKNMRKAYRRQCLLPQKQGFVKITFSTNIDECIEDDTSLISGFVKS